MNLAEMRAMDENCVAAGPEVRGVTSGLGYSHVPFSAYGTNVKSEKTQDWTFCFA